MSVSWDDLEIGSRVEALETFEVQMGMGAPVGNGSFNIEAGGHWRGHGQTPCR